MKKNETTFSKDLAGKKLFVARSFDAPLNEVWEAWTTSEILDQWWAPHPYKVKTKTMDFKPGGYWLYAMISPEGEATYSRENYKEIEPKKLISNSVFFCDEAGTENKDFGISYWKKEFQEDNDQTKVEIEISFDKLEDLEQIINMGFEEGFRAGLGNLEAYFQNK